MMFWLFVCPEFIVLVTSEKPTQYLSSFFFFSFEDCLCKSLKSFLGDLGLGLSKV